MRDILTGAALMLAGITVGFCLNDVARKGWPELKPRERRLSLPTPVVAREALTPDLPLKPPPARPARQEVVLPPTVESHDREVSETYYEMKRRLDLVTKSGPNAGALLA